MSLNQLIDEHVSLVFMNTEDFASDLVRYVCGDSANTQQIVGIVTVHTPVVDDMRGRGYIHRADVVLDESVVVTESDGILYGGFRFEVESIGIAEHGLKTMFIVRYQPESKGAKPIRSGG